MGHNELRDALRQGLTAAFNNPQSDLAAQILRDSYGLLGLAVRQTHLTPGDMVLPNSYLLADMLVSAGALERHGNEMQSTSYEITPHGKELYGLA